MVGDTRYWPAAGRLDGDGDDDDCVSRDDDDVINIRDDVGGDIGGKGGTGGGTGGSTGGGGALLESNQELVASRLQPELVVLGPQPELVALHCLSVQFYDGGGASPTASGLPEAARSSVPWWRTAHTP